MLQTDPDTSRNSTGCVRFSLDPLPSVLTSLPFCFWALSVASMRDPVPNHDLSLRPPFALWPNNTRLRLPQTSTGNSVNAPLLLVHPETVLVLKRPLKAHQLPHSRHQTHPIHATRLIVTNLL